MDTILLDKSTDKLTLKEGQLLHWEHETVCAHYPVCSTESVQVYGNAQITTQAVKECLKEGIRILYFNAYGKYLGRLEPDYPKNIRRRLEQYRLYWDTERRLMWAKSLIESKLQGALIELRRWKEQKHAFPYAEIRRELKKRQKEITSAPDLAALRGIEGNSARIYYHAFGHVLPDGILWNGRSSHPPADRINALLSLIYVVTARVIRDQMEKHSLDPHCGFLHEPGYGGGGLASDLLEIIRPTFCDHLAVRLLHRNPAIRRILKNAPSNGRLPDETGKNIAALTGDALMRRCRFQKSSPLEQIREILSLTVAGLNECRPNPGYLQIHPER